jgi:hypothetical protein
MAFDFKKEYRAFYLPKGKPEIVRIPKMNFACVRGRGNPNDANGEYKRAVGALYGIAYTIRMSHKGDHRIEGFFEYVVPPLEGLWWMDGRPGVDFSRKDEFCWISMIRLPDFVKRDDFDWAVSEATKKKKADFSAAEFFAYDEGLCVQCMHAGPFDAEPATVAAMDGYAVEQGYRIDFSDARMHHEIYLSDITKANPENWKTVIRHPVRSANPDGGTNP